MDNTNANSTNDVSNVLAKEEKKVLSTRDVETSVESENKESFHDACMKIKEQLVLNPDYQYKQGGKLYQMAAKFKPDPRSTKEVAVSFVVNHTPNSKYDGATLRRLRAERGVGKVKRTEG